MFFSDYFKVDKKIIKDYGAIDISLVSDSPLFIDPLLIYGNSDPVIKKQYSKITQYLLFLNNKAKAGLTNSDINIYFKFKEVKQNWLGMCSKGNSGLALGSEFAKELSERIAFICNTNGVSDDIHVEKMYLVNPGVGKDKISDWTTNILLGFFVDYTEKFAKQYIDASYCKIFEIRRSSFNYQTGLFESKDAYLPFILDKKGRPEFVLLTPSSILRVEEQDISYYNFESQFDILRKTISNEELRHQINTIYRSEVQKLYLEKSELENTVLLSEIDAQKREAALKIVAKYPVLYDYFIAKEENDIDVVREKSKTEIEAYLKAVLENDILDSDVLGFKSSVNEFANSHDECIYRLGFLKKQIEINGVWKALYPDGKPIKKEDNLQALFKLLWCRSKYMFSPESNSGAGPSDFILSYGRKDSTVMEFKLASNPKLKSVFAQTRKYAKSHGATNKSVITIFYFDEKEHKKALEIKNNANQDEFVVLLIDCDSSTKQSASHEVGL